MDLTSNEIQKLRTKIMDELADDSDCDSIYLEDEDNGVDYEIFLHTKIEFDSTFGRVMETRATSGTKYTFDLETGKELSREPIDKFDLHKLKIN